MSIVGFNLTLRYYHTSILPKRKRFSYKNYHELQLSPTNGCRFATVGRPGEGFQAVLFVFFEELPLYPLLQLGFRPRESSAPGEVVADNRHHTQENDRQDQEDFFGALHDYRTKIRCGFKSYAVQTHRSSLDRLIKIAQRSFRQPFIF